jgi:hypothetical protein
MEQLGVERWIASLREHRASHIQQRESRGGMLTNDTFGVTSSGSSKSVSPPWCSSKMFQPSFNGFDLSAKNYADWVSTLRQESSARRNAGRLKSVNDYLCWRTPDAPGKGGIRNRIKSVGKGHQLTIAEQAEHWQTPGVDSFRSRGGDRKHEMGLDQQARLFQFGHLDPAMQQDGDQSFNDGQTSRQLWPTPIVEMDSGPNNHYKGDRKAGRQLQEEAARWPTPRTGNDSGSKVREKQGANPGLKEMARNYPDPDPKKKLNPRFVCWLMGWPPDWTSLAPISSERQAMALSQSWAHLRSLLSGTN